MKDKELADKVVALGAGYKIKADDEQYCVFSNCDWCDTVSASELVRDWRVAGALIEKYEASDDFSPHGLMEAIVLRKQDSIPRSILQACVEALEPVQRKQTQG